MNSHINEDVKQILFLLRRNDVYQVVTAISCMIYELESLTISHMNEKGEAL